MGREKMAYQTAMIDRLCDLMSEYEGFMGAEAVIQAISEALGLEAERLEQEGIYMRSAKYEAAAMVLRRK